MMHTATQAYTSPVSAIPTSFRADQAIKKVTPGLTKELVKKKLTLGRPVFMRIFKKPAILEVWLQAQSEKYVLFKTYKICAYSGTLGPKEKKGDKQAPEGFYFVPPDSLNPYSRFHLSFNLGYPNAYDRIHKRTGSALMVHGKCVSIGCYAMTNKNINEIYTLAHAAFKNGQPFFRVHIFPFKMTPKNMEKYKDNKWYLFWENLKQGYDTFEQDRVPPNVEVKNKKYVFDAVQ